MFTNLLPSEFLCSTTDVRQWAVENSVYHHVWFTASSMPDKLKDNSGSFSMRALLWGLLVSKTSASTCFFQILRKEGVWPPRLFSSTRLYLCNTTLQVKMSEINDLFSLQFVLLTQQLYRHYMNLLGFFSKQSDREETMK